LQILLKEGIGGEREDDFKDNFIEQGVFIKPVVLSQQVYQSSLNPSFWEKASDFCSGFLIVSETLCR
jgi:hypothetical protein